MDFESLGGGALMGSVTSFVTAVLTLLGWNRRLVKLEDNKQEKSDCNVAMKSHEGNINDIKEDVKYIRSRVDKLIDIAINGAK
jgi:uncharacterized membrane protein